MDVPTTTTTTSTSTTDTPMTTDTTETTPAAVSTMVSITESSTTIQYNNKNEVFYNPVQEFNRDLSILMIKKFIETRAAEHAVSKRKDTPLRKVRILEALSATGLRSIRYAKEIEDLDFILSNDIEEAAVVSITKNRDLNGVDAQKLRPNHGDATMVMYAHRDIGKQFDIIDIDPYGSPSIFIDGAVQSIAEGGLLCVTATDSAVLCGNHPEACFHKYASVPLKGDFCHEMGVRILLQSLETAANRYKRHIVPVLSLSIDFYVRVFVRVYTSPLECKSSFSKMANIYSCVGCGSYQVQPLGVVEKVGKSIKYKMPVVSKYLESTNCTHCTKHLVMAGPFWNRPIHNKDVIKSALNHIEANPTAFNTSRRMFAMLTSAFEELHDVPFYFRTDHFTSVLHLTTPPTHFIRSGILNAGYQVSSSHVASVIKTNAPFEFLWDLFRTYAKTCPPKNISATAPAHFILAKEPVHKVDFNAHPKAHGDTPDLPKYLPNPRENWGPGSRAGKRQNDESHADTIAQKRTKNQGKYSEGKDKKEFKEIPCRNFHVVGECGKGDGCKYSHAPITEDNKDSTLMQDIAKTE
eukprot:gene8675-10187_t